MCHLNFNSDPEIMARFKKAFIGVLVNPGMSYNIQTCFEVDGYFFNQGNSFGC